jgi:hypothetical protein
LCLRKVPPATIPGDDAGPPRGQDALALIIVGVMVVLVPRIPRWSPPCTRALGVVGRVALAVAGLVAFSGFASALVNILGRP